MIKRIMLVVVAIFAALFMTGCSVAANSDEVYVHKGGGVWEAADPKGCITPASREFQKPGDAYYAYPANQRDYNFTGGDKTDGPPFSVVSKDGQTLTVVGTLFFTLNPNCDVLQRFHDKIGNRKGAYFTEGMENTPEGWLEVLNLYMRPALDSTLDRVAKQYTWSQLYSDPSIKDELNAAVNDKVRQLINQQFEGNDEYFINFSAQILQPQAAADLVALAKDQEINTRQAANAEVKARADAKALEVKANAQVAQKEAELRVAQKEAQIKAAEINAYGGVKNWLDAKAIEKGLNPWQPMYSGGAIIDTTK
jgi:regulator of protease activity HflC (stomatin/prohibitin superfamily)